MNDHPPDSRLADELARLVTETTLSESADVDRQDAVGILRIIHEQDRRVADAVGACLPQIARIVEAVTESFRGGGRLLYVGAGTSGRLGVLDAAECPPTFGTDPEEVVGLIAGGRESMFRAQEGAEDDGPAGGRDLETEGLAAIDTVVGIAASRRTPYVHGALEHARRIGCFTALVTCNPGDDAEIPADVVVAPVVGPEVITGSTRMKAGTAQKLVLNMITTATMVRRGKTFGNRMIDLRPGSRKLVERSRTIVREIVGTDYAGAVELLAAADGRVKTAIVMGRLGLDRDAAERRLEAADGLIRPVLEGDA